MAIRMKAPDGCNGVSWNGNSYDNKKGFVTVPDEAAIDLVSLGFVLADDNADPQALKAQNLIELQDKVQGAQAALDAEIDPVKRDTLQGDLEELTAQYVSAQG